MFADRNEVVYMFLDIPWRPEGEPPQQPDRPISNIKIAFISALAPTFVFSGMLGVFALKTGYAFFGALCLGVAIIALQLFLLHGFDVLFSLRSNKKKGR